MSAIPFYVQVLLVLAAAVIVAGALFALLLPREPFDEDALEQRADEE